MKQLRFNEYSNEEWRKLKKELHALFWSDMDRRRLRDMRWLMQQQINAEFNEQIGALQYERTPGRRDDRNGSRPRTYEIMGGRLVDLKIPRARELDIRFTVFDAWEQVQPKVVHAMLVAYLLGRSSSAAADIIEAFGQSRFSRSFLQRLVKKFEERLKRYLNRKIVKKWPYVFIDGMAVKVRDIRLKEKVVIFAYGMDNDKKSELLGWVVAESEDEVSVRGLLIDLKRRGLETPELFISDDARGITAALKLEYPHVPWQLCSFHKMQNIQQHLIDIAHRKEILREAGDIYQRSRNRKEAVRRFEDFVAHWKRKEPVAVKLFAQGFEHTLRYFAFPEHMWVSLRTNNPLEQLIGKMRNWTSRFTYFQGQANLNLAIFTYLCHKSGELVSDCFDEPECQKYTLSIV